MVCLILDFPARAAVKGSRRRPVAHEAGVVRLSDYRHGEARRLLRLLADWRRERRNTAERVARLKAEGAEGGRAMASRLAAYQFSRNLRSLGLERDAEAALRRLPKADAASLRREARSWA